MAKIIQLSLVAVELHLLAMVMQLDPVVQIQQDLAILQSVVAVLALRVLTHYPAVQVAVDLGHRHQQLLVLVLLVKATQAAAVLLMELKGLQVAAGGLAQ
jgi:hypothetical protein